MPAPEIIHQLVQQFSDNRDAYRSGRYNEAQLRQEFLNPFFEALGWDVSNRKGFSINYREVVHEDSIHIKGSPHAKAPDYAPPGGCTQVLRRSQETGRGHPV